MMDEFTVPEVESEKPFECKICHQHFQAKQTLRQHIHTHTGARPYQCKVCAKRFTQAASLDRHIQTHGTEVKPFTCPVCSASFRQANNLRRHLTLHDENAKTFNCEFCLRRFKRKEGLLRHVKTHLSKNERLFCRLCEKSFADEKILNRHMKWHYDTVQSGVSTCSRCSGTFINQGLRSNPSANVLFNVCDQCVSSESTATTIVCQICSFVTESVTEFNDHVCSSAPTSAKPVEPKFTIRAAFACKICKDLYPSRSALLKHYPLHRYEVDDINEYVPVYECNDCDKNFTSRITMIRHTKKHGRIHEKDHCELVEVELEDCDLNSGSETSHDQTELGSTIYHKGSIDETTVKEEESITNCDALDVLEIFDEKSEEFTQRENSKIFEDIDRTVRNKYLPFDVENLLKLQRNVQESVEQTKNEDLLSTTKSKRYEECDDPRIIISTCGKDKYEVRVNDVKISDDNLDVFLEAMQVPPSLAELLDTSRNTKSEETVNPEKLFCDSTGETSSDIDRYINETERDQSVDFSYDADEYSDGNANDTIANLRTKSEQRTPCKVLDSIRKSTEGEDIDGFLAERWSSVGAADGPISIRVVFSEQDVNKPDSYVDETVETASLLLEERTTSALNSPRSLVDSDSDPNHLIGDRKRVTKSPSSGQKSVENSRSIQFTKHNALNTVASELEIVHVLMDDCNETEQIFELKNDVMEEDSGRRTEANLCSQCHRGFSLKSSLKRHMRDVHSNKAKISCARCSTTFSSKDALKKHMRALHEEHRFRCAMCDKTFNRKDGLASHQRLHVGDKPFACKVCGERFAQKQNLYAHSKKHGEKKHLCDICDKKFHSKSELTRHMPIHTGERKYKCDLCEMSFIQPSHLTHHYQTHKPVKQFECTMCGKGFSRKHSLQRHVNACHER